MRCNLLVTAVLQTQTSSLTQADFDTQLQKASLGVFCALPHLQTRAFGAGGCAWSSCSGGEVWAGLPVEAGRGCSS